MRRQGRQGRRGTQGGDRGDCRKCRYYADTAYFDEESKWNMIISDISYLGKGYSQVVFQTYQYTT